MTQTPATSSILDADFLERFAAEMQHNTDVKGDWRRVTDDEEMDWQWMLDELDDHVRKLKEALRSGSGLSKVQEHCADIAGNAMMCFRFAAQDDQRIQQALQELDD